MTRYAVLGAGAIGGFYGGMLASAGHEVHFIVRGDYEALREHGLRVTTDDDVHVVQPVQVHRSAETVPPCDVVLSTLKMTQLSALSDYLPQILSEEGVVIALQNGLGAEDAVAQLVAAERVFGAVCFICATRPSAGQICQSDTNEIRIAPFVSGVQNALVTALVERLGAIGVKASLGEALGILRWRKLVWNIPYNGICAHLGQSTTLVNDHPETRQLVRDLMEEVRAGCAAVTGQDLPAELPEQLITMTDGFNHYKPSMLIDAEEARPMELEAILAEPARRAAQAGVPMRCTEMLYRLMKAQADQGHG